MPFYEYVCRGCGHEFEMMRAMSERDRPLRCPTCQSDIVERKLSRFAVSDSAGSAAAIEAGCPPERARKCGNYG